MNGREFVDTNVLVYAFDRTAGKKREIAVALLARLWSDRIGCLSLQVLQEFYVTATKKLKMGPAEALAQIDRFGKWTVHRPEISDVLVAIHLHREKKIPFWDAMILRSAMSSGCDLLWSEDLSDGQRWDGVTVRNPF
ncbi:MAG TPA: PIN domain-containing protein [Bryobacteraceae bacterium]